MLFYTISQSFLTSGIRNEGCSCYLNCLLQIIANYTPLFFQISKISPQKELEVKFYLTIQKLMQSKEPISANCFFILISLLRPLIKSISDTINLFHLEEELSHHIKIQGCLFHFSQCLVKTSFLKKDEIYELMNEIVETYMMKSDNGQIDSDFHIVDEGAEEWCEYNEQSNESFNDFLFEDSLNNNSNIINQQMNRILNQFKSD